jgi:hypothetical protein
MPRSKNVTVPVIFAPTGDDRQAYAFDFPADNEEIKADFRADFDGDPQSIRVIDLEVTLDDAGGYCGDDVYDELVKHEAA